VRAWRAECAKHENSKMKLEIKEPGSRASIMMTVWSALTPALSRRRKLPGLCVRFAPRNLRGIRPVLPLFPTQEGGEGRGEEELFLWMAPLSDSLPVRSSRGEREEGSRRAAGYWAGSATDIRSNLQTSFSASVARRIPIRIAWTTGGARLQPLRPAFSPSPGG